MENQADLTRKDVIMLIAVSEYIILSGVNLQGLNLSKLYLNSATLTGANLSYADITGADLTGANLEGADLTGADLTGANLEGADLTGASGLTVSQLEAGLGNPNF